MLVIQNNILKQLLSRNVQELKVYNALAVPILLYGSEIWDLKKKG